MYWVVGWCSRDIIHIRWTSKRKSVTLRTIVLVLIIVWWSIHDFDHIQIRTSAWPIQTSHGFSPQQVLGILGVRRTWLHRTWTSLVLQRVVVTMRRSLSVEDLVQIPPSGHICPGSRPVAVCNYGKGTTTPWRKRLRRHVVAGHRQDGGA